MTDPKLEKKIEKLLNYKCLNYLSGNNKYKSKSSTPNHSSLKDTPNTDRSDSKSNKHYPVIVEKHHKNSSLATNYSDLPYIKETRNNFDKNTKTISPICVDRKMKRIVININRLSYVKFINDKIFFFYFVILS